MANVQADTESESVSLAEAARTLHMSKDRLYGWMGGLGIRAMQTTGGQPGSKGGKPPVLLTRSQVDKIRQAHSRYTGQRV